VIRDASSYSANSDMLWFGTVDVESPKPPLTTPPGYEPTPQRPDCYPPNCSGVLNPKRCSETPRAFQAVPRSRPLNPVAHPTGATTGTSRHILPHPRHLRTLQKRQRPQALRPGGDGHLTSGRAHGTLFGT
jgi:hypothetical protein